MRSRSFGSQVRRLLEVLVPAFCLVGLGSLAPPNVLSSEPGKPLSIIVMDPLAAPLSCPCVEGYAQRDYNVLAKHLESEMQSKVTLTFSASLATALKKTKGQADIVIGKQSVVIADAKSAVKKLTPISQLTDPKGETHQFGMIVVNRDDPARSVTDLKDYTIIFGPSEAEEKHSAAIRLLQAAGVSIPKERQAIDEACSDGACKVIDLGSQSKTAAVISSYAQPLLEGCGTIKKGDLRVLGKTKPVPFITLFVADSMDESMRQKLSAALAEVAFDAEVLDALESLAGFLPMNERDEIDDATVSVAPGDTIATTNSEAVAEAELSVKKN